MTRIANQPPIASMVATTPNNTAVITAGSASGTTASVRSRGSGAGGATDTAIGYAAAAVHGGGGQRPQARHR